MAGRYIDDNGNCSNPFVAAMCNSTRKGGSRLVGHNMFPPGTDPVHRWKTSSEIMSDSRKLLETVRAGITESQHAADVARAIVDDTRELLAASTCIALRR